MQSGASNSKARQQTRFKIMKFLQQAAAFCRAASASFLFLFFFYFFCLNPICAQAADFAVTSPWVGEIATFIAGDKVKVRNLAAWDSNGAVVPVSRPKAGELVIAVDSNDALRFKLKKTNKNVRLLYEILPMTEDQFRTAFYDPAILPFIAQNVMKIIAEADKPRYSYYQRRLAEFQSHVDSTIDIGRHGTEQRKILDITMSAGAWIRSSVQGTVRPPEAVWKSWIHGDTAALKAALDEAKRRGWLILLDVWTPTAIRSVAASYENRFTIPPPSDKKEYFMYLHEIFVSVRNKIKMPNAK